jgi:hypothetical protein
MRVFLTKGRVCLLVGYAIVGYSFVVGATAYGSPVSPVQCSNPGSTTFHTLNDGTVNANSCTDFAYSYPNTNNAAGIPTSNWLYGYYSYNSGFLNLGSQTPVFTPLGQQITDSNGHFLGWWANNFDQYWTSLDAFGGHSNSTLTDFHAPPYCDNTLYQNCGSGQDPRSPNSPDSANQFAVRRYEIPVNYNGTVDITIQVQKDYRVLGPGVSPAADGDFNYVVEYINGVPTLLTNSSGGNMLQTPTPASLLQTPNPGPNSFPIETETFFNVPVHGGDFLDFIMAPGANDYSDGEFQLITIQSAPEPTSFLLVGAGLLLIGMRRWRR